MLPLKYLFHDYDLALTILSRWDYDVDQPQLLQRFRISANAVYPFHWQGRQQFLRFAPASEKSAPAVLSELDFLRYLRQSGYPCPDIVPSRQGMNLEAVETEGGTYHAVVFTGVPGESLHPESMTDGMISGWGETLGWLHRLSRDYRPCKSVGLLRQRIDYRGQLQWMTQVLRDFPDQDLALREVSIVGDWLESLPRDEAGFGLIHYDFETDNTFYHRDTGSFHVIDFDDAVYHWFAMDVFKALHSFAEDAPTNRVVQARQLFLAGYRRQRPFDDQWLALAPGFERYQNLYGYVRILRSTREQMEQEPDWMLKLRQHLARRMQQRAACFGQPIR